MNLPSSRSTPSRVSLCREQLPGTEIGFSPLLTTLRYFCVWSFCTVAKCPSQSECLSLAGLGSKRFWFTDLASVSTDDAASILKKVFFTPKDFEQGALYSF